MKNLLLFNYNIEIDQIKEVEKDIYNFYIDYNNFYFIHLKRPLEELIEISNFLKLNNNEHHMIIKNKFDKIVTEYEQKPFVLLKIKGAENCEIDLINIINSQTILTDNKSKLLLRNNWGELWSYKVDYLEYQMSELGKNHILAIKSFSYFVGLAENAIAYYNDLKIENPKLALVQKRIQFPNINLNFNNPIDLVIDYRIRDISEYMKSAFYNNYDCLSEVDNIITKNLLSPLEYNLIFVRLLFPTHYFDDLTKVIERNADDDILLKYLSTTKDYEDFLKKVYYKFSKVCSLSKINWLLKD